MGDFFQWKPELNMNVPEIDEQHRYLIGLVNDYYRSLTGESGKEDVADVLSFLIGYVKVHFTREEELMNENSYPGRAAHVAQHIDLSEKVAAMVRLYEEGEPPQHIELALFLREWLNEHIRKYDRELAAWIISRKPRHP